MTLGSRLPRESFLGSVWLYHMHSLKSKLRSSFWIIVALFNRNTFSMWNLREWEVKLQGDLKTNERAASAFFFLTAKSWTEVTRMHFDPSLAGKFFYRTRVKEFVAQSWRKSVHFISVASSKGQHAGWSKAYAIFSQWGSNRCLFRRNGKVT